MSDKGNSSRVSPYDLSAIRRASTNVVKTPTQARQPYTLSTSQRLMKSTVVIKKKLT